MNMEKFHPQNVRLVQNTILIQLDPKATEIPSSTHDMPRFCDGSSSLLIH